MGLLGPVVSATGLFWLAFDTVVDPRTGKFGFHHLMFSGPHLVIAAGVALSFVAVPLALKVALASDEEVEIPIFDKDLEEEEDFQAQPAPR